MTTVAAPTALDYAAIFRAECEKSYAVMDDLEGRYGFALDRITMEEAARILACPLKPHAPNWQHGRMVYAVTRSYLLSHPGPVALLDIGTAKGFSALCLQWALVDSGKLGAVVSVDVLDPAGTQRRNSVLEVDGPKTLAQFLQPWKDAQSITFLKSTGVEWLVKHPARVHVAFVDGKHTGAVVWQEGRLLAQKQEPGDIVMFDDLQIDGVAAAVKDLKREYEIEYVRLSEDRCYAIGVRRG